MDIEILKMKEQLLKLKPIKITEAPMSEELRGILIPNNIVLRTVTLERVSIPKKCEKCYREADYLVKETENYYCWTHCLD